MWLSAYEGSNPSPRINKKMKTSKTRIKRKMERKTDSELAETIHLACKHKPWSDIANKISRPRRMQPAINIGEIDRETKEGDTVLVPGKVLSSGSVSKKIRIVALGFSEEARKKLKEKKCEIVLIREEIKVNPKAQGIKLIE